MDKVYKRVWKCWPIKGDPNYPNAQCEVIAFDEKQAKRYAAINLKTTPKNVRVLDKGIF